MLTRAARRRNHLRYAQSVAERLQLPFLCPLLSRTDHLHSPRRSITSRPAVVRPQTASTPLSQSRHLASAAPLPDVFDRTDDYPSLAYGSRDPPIAQRRAHDFSTLQSWDLENILHIDASISRRPERNNTSQVNGNEIRGNVTEVERNFEACLVLKKWHRALAGLQQLGLLYHTDHDRLRFQYNRVLAHLVDDMVETQTSDHEERITQWIERDMKHAGLEPDAYTLALVIKAALASSGRSKRDRTVRRYWDMAKRYDLQAQVGSLRSILLERDLGVISEICPLEAADLKELELSEPDILVTEDLVSERPDLGIKETDQKGMGMTSLRQTLLLFADAEDKNELQLEKNLQERETHATQRQRRLETDAISAAIHRWKIEHEKMLRMGISGDMSNGRLGALLWQWHTILTTKIEEEVKKTRQAEAKPHKTPQDRLRLEYGPFLEHLAPDKLAAVTVISLIQIMSKFGISKNVKLVYLVTELGKAVESEYQADQRREVRKTTREHYSWLADTFAEPPSDEILSTLQGTQWSPLTRRGSHPAAHCFLNFSEWTGGIHAKLGSILCEMMFDTARMAVTKQDETSGKEMSIAQPCFIRKRIYVNGKSVGAVSLHESFIGILSSMPPSDIIAKQLPMLCVPQPWKAFREGAYLESHQPVLRVKNGESLQRAYVVAAAARGDLDQLFAGLDVLGATAWKINPKVFEVMAQAWNSGEEVANLPPLNKTFDYPERPPADASRKVKYEWYAKLRSIEYEKSGLHSNRCFQNFQMEIAKAFLGETFYLPHNMDFRGRAYPIPPYLNQMGADNARGLLMFAQGRPLGPEGLRWLKIHLANVFGFDKASLEDRAQFPIDHMDDIRDSVSYPLTGKKWWLTAEDPWQCLATSIELVQALDSPDVTKFVSHLPVHQDGSCNGLQHYAALGGDMAGAKQVNLEPGLKPADVYTGVADLVSAEVAIDAAAGSDIGKRMNGRITRKIVKQTVMTNVYGVTFMGAIRQVRRQIDTIYPEFVASQISGKAASYIARKIFKAMGALFTGAHEIQYWLGDCANRITGSLSPAQMQQILERETAPQKFTPARRGRRLTKVVKKNMALDPTAFRNSVVWTTPLKLPVVQPYRVNKGRKILTTLQRITLCEPSAADAVNKKKQLQAFPPNFVHSLDATHMMLSALKAHEEGLTFTAVHDSFWTHAADVNNLSQLLREAFIRMHKEDIISRLAAEFRTRYEGHLYMAQIRASSPLGQALKKYRQQMIAEGSLPSGSNIKAVRAQKYAELLREIRRTQLLASSDAEERRVGEETVTAATLFRQYDGEQYIESQDSLGETALGSVPHESDVAEIEQTLQNEDARDVVHKGSMGQRLLDMESDTDMEHEVQDVASHKLQESDSPDQDEQSISSPSIEIKEARSVRKNASKSARSIYAWLPLKFRPVPAKGDFDVNRLRESLYFFS